MKKYLLALALLIIPFVLYASPVSVNRLDNDHIEPLKSTDYIKAQYLVGSSTTATTTAPNLAVTSAFNFLGTVITNVSTWFNGLFDTQLATKTTTNLAEGTNLYYTTARVNTDAPNVTLAGTPDYITIAGQVLTRNTVDISDDTNLTAGDGLTLTGDDIDCDTASGSVFGCLSSTDWTTFNNKLSTATAASTYVPYTGATANVDLGANDFDVSGTTTLATTTVNGDLYVADTDTGGFTLLSSLDGVVGAYQGASLLCASGGGHFFNALQLGDALDGSLLPKCEAVNASNIPTGTLPVARGGTGITSLGTGIATWWGTPSSANLASALTDETGTGVAVFGTSPTFTTQITSPLVYGSSASGGSLTLRSTSNATKGPITLDEASGYVINESGADADFRVEGDTDANLLCTDAANNRVGVLTCTPLFPLHVEGGSANIPLQVESTGATAQIKLNGTGTMQFTLTTSQGAGRTAQLINNGTLIAFKNATDDTGSFALRGQSNINGFVYDFGAPVNSMRIESTGNTKIGGSAAVRATTEGTNHLDIFDGTAPVGTLANGISLYSTSGELRVMDAGGTATLLSPHDEENKWVFSSEDKAKGTELHIDVEDLLRTTNSFLGTDNVHGDMTDVEDATAPQTLADLNEMIAEQQEQIDDLEARLSKLERGGVPSLLDIIKSWF